jgi:hypothetical protein
LGKVKTLKPTNTLGANEQTIVRPQTPLRISSPDPFLRAASAALFVAGTAFLRIVELARRKRDWLFFS